MKFTELQIIKPILKALMDSDYDIASPIQSEAIPIILSGKDIFASAQTGTGKTAAFAIPILQGLAKNNANDKTIKALILTPTRELAAQVGNSFRKYGKYLNLKVNIIFGGVPQKRQIQSLRRGCDILVATPGRLLDLISQRKLTINNVNYFVLDEADRMMDMGFIIDVKKIVAKMNKDRQTMLFSATLPGQIKELSKAILKKPVNIHINPSTKTIKKINQAVFYVSKKNKLLLLYSILQADAVKSALVFVRTKKSADKIVRELNALKINAAAIHSDKSQGDRTKTLKDFKLNKIKFLVATDIASRGLDIEQLPYVINYDLPEDAETYIHRIGRTGRAGLGGTALSFCSEGEAYLIKKIEKHINHKIKVIDSHPFANDREIIFRNKRVNNKYRKHRRKSKSRKYYKKP